MRAVFLFEQIKGELVLGFDGKVHLLFGLGVGKGEAAGEESHVRAVILCAVLSVAKQGHFP